MSHGYDLGSVRALLLAAFTAEELARFCYDRPAFRPVCQRFGPGHGLDDMANELLTYAHNRLLLDELLAAVREHNPRQFDRFEAGLLTPVPAADADGPHAPIPARAWLLLALLLVDVGLLLIWGWCLFGRDPGIVAYVDVAIGLAGLLVAILAIIVAVRRPVAAGDVVQALGRERRWTWIVLAVTAACLAGTFWLCRARGAPRPTAYVALILDNGPVPDARAFAELREEFRVELSRALPRAALALRVFGPECGQTRRLVDYQTGNAAAVATALDEIETMPRSDLTEAVRQALDGLLARPAGPPRILILVTWGADGCGGDLETALARYRQQLGSAVSLTVIAMDEPPAITAGPGVYVQPVDSAREAGQVLGAINRAIEDDAWPPRTPGMLPTPGPQVSP